MRGSCVIRGIGLEPYREDIVLVFPCNMNVVCSSFFMLKLHSGQLQFGDVLGALNCETMKLVTRFRQSTDVCDEGSKWPSANEVDGIRPDETLPSEEQTPTKHFCGAMK